MADLASLVEALPVSKTVVAHRPKKASSRAGTALFVLALLCGLAYIGVHVAHDLDTAAVSSAWPFALLALALVIALGFEFVNGFHDTANAVATVIYTNSLAPNVAVIWSGICNLMGVLFSSGTVAFAVVTLLPVELILKVSSGTGFALVFALLLAAILWNLGTWWFGLPASSSHTLVGSIIGVGLANQLLSQHSGSSGLDWKEVVTVLKALLISPVLGFVLAGFLILASKWLLDFPSLYEVPKDNQPPPLPIRALMVLTCTGVSYLHGSNDGQKGMGLIMLILIGTVPTAYALNHNLSPTEVQQFIVASQQTEQILDRYASPAASANPDPRTELTTYIKTKQLHADTLPALRQVVAEMSGELQLYKSFQSVPAQDQGKMRNDMYVTGEALRLMQQAKAPAFSAQQRVTLAAYANQLNKTTKFIPAWVKVAVALALGLGTMVGWRRIVVTVGEKIGKERMTYAQGASAGLVTMATIFAADRFGLPVSTTHILSSGVAGTMAANGSGLRLSTVRNIAAGWVLTLPAAALLSGMLFCLFRAFF